MTLKKTVLMVVFQHYSLNDRNNYWVSFVPPGSLPESGHHSSFLCGCFFHLQIAVLLAHCSVCVPEEKGHKSSSYVWNSGEQWEGPWRNKVMSLTSTSCGGPGKGWTQNQTERQGLSLSSLFNVLLGRKMEIRRPSIEHSKVHGECRTRSTAGSPLTLKCTHCHSKYTMVSINYITALCSYFDSNDFTNSWSHNCLTFLIGLILCLWEKSSGIKSIF